MNRYGYMGNFGGFPGMPQVLKGLILANVGIFLLQHFVLQMFTVGGGSLAEQFFYWLALFPIADGSNFQFWQVISYQFLHGGFMHLFWNMLVLWMFGRELEMMWGSSRFLTFYLLCGIGAAIVQLVISPMFSSIAPTVGASGSIMGIMVAFALLEPNRTVIVFPIFVPIKIKYVIIFIIAGDLLMGFMAQNDMVAHFAHLGGAAAGWILYKFGDNIGIFKLVDRIFGVKSKNTDTFGSFYQRPSNIYEQEPYWQRPANPFQSAFKQKEEPRPEPQKSNIININGEEITQQKIDEILDKISESGYQNLTDREKRILFELSQKIK